MEEDSLVRKTILGFATAVVAAVATAAPAQALENPADLTAINAPAKVSIGSSSCRNIPIQYSVGVEAGWEFWGADVNVLRNGEQHSLELISGAGQQSYFYCPYFDGLGKFQWGPSTVTAWSDDAVDVFEFNDASKDITWIRAKSTASVTATRKGSKVTFTARTKRYNIDADEYRNWSSPKIVLQRKKADGTWVDVAAMAYTSKGVAKKTITASTAKTYRVISSDTTLTWGRASTTVRR